MVCKGLKVKMHMVSNHGWINVKEVAVIKGGLGPREPDI